MILIRYPLDFIQRRERRGEKKREGLLLISDYYRTNDNINI